MRQFCFPNFPADLQEKKHQKQDKNGGAPSKKESFPAKSSEDDEFLNHVHQVGTVLFHLHLLGSKGFEWHREATDKSDMLVVKEIKAYSLPGTGVLPVRTAPCHFVQVVPLECGCCSNCQRM